MKDIRKAYIDAMDTIHAAGCLSGRVKDIEKSHGQEIEHARKRGYKKTIAAAGVAAAVLAMVLFVPDTSAKYIKKVFEGFWGSQKETSSYIEQADSSFCLDEDNHISLFLEEILSDEVCIQAVVKFKAKDEAGIEWLNAYNPDVLISSRTIKGKFIDALCIAPDLEDGMEDSGLRGIAELKKYKSDNERYFAIQYLADQPVCKGILHYSLPSGNDKKKEIDIKSNVPVYNYTLSLEGSKGISRYYEPRKIRMSGLSVIVYGKDTGLLAAGGKGGEEYSSEYLAEEDKEYFQSAGMVKEDGTIEDLGYTGVCKGRTRENPKEENEGCDCIILSKVLCCIVAFGTNNNEKTQYRQDVISFMPEKYKGIYLETGNGKATYMFK